MNGEEFGEGRRSNLQINYRVNTNILVDSRISVICELLSKQGHILFGYPSTLKIGNHSMSKTLLGIHTFHKNVANAGSWRFSSYCHHKSKVPAGILHCKCGEPVCKNIDKFAKKDGYHIFFPHSSSHRCYSLIHSHNPCASSKCSDIAENPKEIILEEKSAISPSALPSAKNVDNQLIHKGRLFNKLQLCETKEEYRKHEEYSCKESCHFTSTNVEDNNIVHVSDSNIDEETTSSIQIARSMTSNCCVEKELDEAGGYDKGLTHLDEKGNARMVDIGGKASSSRVAVARSVLWVGEKAGILIRDGGIEKGNVFGVARVAGIMAAKSTSSLIPLCHQVALTSVKVDLRLDTRTWEVVTLAHVSCEGSTGVEMEALVACSIASLTVYDMVKAVAGRSGMAIRETCLVLKEGGRKGDYLYGDGGWGREWPD
ncbi:molybdenum cofactor biosynthesis protein 1 isoform X2 [Ischnura elegans]|uniref:molybdenum cofactor biosynthesis protein 1 isoform X2 n=1 Tax=Ischnura elegans TaxID=197161 RepID=UPI001ED8970F|nr:molybdenum cofactor biosynthesis protein 1 isoform X2 [Ischnura elegans]